VLHTSSCSLTFWAAESLLIYFKQSAFHACASRFGARASRSHRIASLRRTSRTNPRVRRMVPRRRNHQQDGRAEAAQASAPSPTASDVISKTDELQQLREARHRHRSQACFPAPGSSSANKRTRRGPSAKSHSFVWTRPLVMWARSRKPN
jgi:O-methyltransferase involved in polyketide biosynthesis